MESFPTSVKIIALVSGSLAGLLCWLCWCCPEKMCCCRRQREDPILFIPDDDNEISYRYPFDDDDDVLVS
jgi:hypothetical protein